MPWWGAAASAAQSKQGKKTNAVAMYHHHQQYLQNQRQMEGNLEVSKLPSITAVAKALLVARRRLRLAPGRRLYFMYEPGKQVSSAIQIKNTSRSPVAFKFQTNAPKSCFMRPPNGILAPGETLMAIVVKFIEPSEPGQEKSCKDKFKIVSLKVKPGTEFTPELFVEQKEYVVIERVLQVVYLNPQGQSAEVEKLKRRLADAEVAHQARSKPLEEKAQRTITGGGVLDEWKEQQREKRLAKQQIGDGVDSP